MLIYFKYFALFIATIAISTVCFSQKGIILGLNFTAEKTSSSDVVVGFGGTFESKFKGRHGFETGVYYRTFDVHQKVFVDGSLYGLHNIREEYLSLPVLYKFYSSVLNFSLGPTLDIYLGWRQINKGLTFEQDVYNQRDKFQFGLISKISKTINIMNRALLEPEIRYNPVFYNHKSFYGAGLSFKYALEKRRTHSLNLKK